MQIVTHLTSLIASFSLKVMNYILVYCWFNISQKQINNFETESQNA